MKQELLELIQEVAEPEKIAEIVIHYCASVCYQEAAKIRQEDYETYAIPVDNCRIEILALLDQLPTK